MATPVGWLVVPSLGTRWASVEARVTAVHHASRDVKRRKEPTHMAPCEAATMKPREAQTREEVQKSALQLLRGRT